VFSGYGMRLTDDDRRQLLSIARTAITAHLQDRQYEPEDLVRSCRGFLAKPCGAFVTLRVGDTLRGCIGYAESERSLALTVVEVSIKAAAYDPRFLSITLEELDTVSIEVSVLSPLEKIGDFRQVRIGVHGLYLESEMYRGLLLPRVALDNNWDIDTFILQLGKKAGIEDFHAGYPGISVYRFTADVFDEKTLNPNP
jgi:uncharacterized protein